MSENKTQPTKQNVDAFISSVTPPRKQLEALQVLSLMKRVTAWQPVMWGSSLIGFGKYNYKYASGREGSSFITGFSPRKAAISIYIMPGFKSLDDELAALGPHKCSVSCLYLTNLSKIDINILEKLIKKSVESMKQIYPNWEES